MKHPDRSPLTLVAVSFMALLLAGGAAMAQEEDFVETGNEAPWYGSVSLGYKDFEGDEEVRDGVLGELRLGYDVNDRWGLEGVLDLAPYLRRRAVAGGVLQNNTFSVGMAVDGVFHFTRWDRLDPYLAAGVGFVLYGDALRFGRFANAIRGGGGVMYHFNDEWGVRADARLLLADFGADPDANLIVTFGTTWTWGARVEERFMAMAGPADTDRDGLTDAEEDVLGTDPYDPDTDKDRLSDGDEVNRYSTNPLEPDTDLDFLNDGDEVLDHGTDPLLRDSDEGGVADGHEVVEDRTNPLDPADDLYLFELYINFDYDKSVIKPDFFSQLDVIGKVLARNPGSTARIEGHADRTKKSGGPYNKRLSHQRAEAVLDYLADSCGIARGRMEAVGYGFSRPKEPNDPISGNPANRRVDVYIRGLGVEEAIEDLGIGKGEGEVVEMDSLLDEEPAENK